MMTILILIGVFLIIKAIARNTERKKDLMRRNSKFSKYRFRK